jgi:hypothetical protein
VATTVRPVRKRHAGPLAELRSIVIARIMGIVGTIAAIVGLFLSWRAGGIHASDVPVAFLWDRSASGGPSSLILLIPLVAVLAIAMSIPFARRARVVAAVGLLVVAALFAFQVDRTLLPGTGVGDALDTGWYFVTIGAVLAVASSWRPRRGSVRRRLGT